MNIYLNLVRCVANDFLPEIRRQEGIQHNADQFGYTLYDSKLQEIVVEQSGVFRTNCLDWYVLLFTNSSSC